MVKVITKEVFQSRDGKMFNTKAEAQDHEESLDQVKYFVVHYSPDLTEGRVSSQASGIIGVNAAGSHNLFAEHACFALFGSRWAFVQGVFGDNAIIPNWRLAEEIDDKGERKLLATVQARFTKSKLWKDGVNKL